MYANVHSGENLDKLVQYIHTKNNYYYFLNASFQIFSHKNSGFHSVKKNKSLGMSSGSPTPFFVFLLDFFAVTFS